MILRICDNGNERLEPASPERVAQVLAPDVPIADGTEITVAEGDRWLTALVVGMPGTPAELLMSGADGDTATVSGVAARPDALRLFHEFMAARGSIR
ncbi:MAG TPA: hypothetical protein VH764_17785 [Gemmatimonadales bacterium]|jgi:hypothetical protein